MERKIAECTTYQELAQTMCDLLRYYYQNIDAEDMDSLWRYIDRAEKLRHDAQDKIDSYDLEPEVQ